MPICDRCRKQRTGIRCSICNEPSCERCNVTIMQTIYGVPQVETMWIVCVGGNKCHFDLKVKLGQITPVKATEPTTIGGKVQR